MGALPDPRRMRPPVPVSDALGGALQFLRSRRIVCCRSEFTAPWALELPALPDSLMFHAVLSGSCRISAKGQPAAELRAGDLVLVPHGQGHVLSSARGVRSAALFDLPRTWEGDHYEVLRHGGGGAPTTVLCGAIQYDHPAAAHFVALLPEQIRIEPRSPEEAGWVESALRFLAAEAREPRPGGGAVITRLADILVIEAMRSWIARGGGAVSGWLAGLEDRQIGRALANVHADPARSWTLAQLAREAALSRSAFASRFAAVVGEPAMAYILRWKMLVALGWLREGDASVEAIAERLGYHSGAAFSRAFKRTVGIAPGAARLVARAEVPARR